MPLIGFTLHRMEGITSMPQGFGTEGASKTHVKGACLIETAGLLTEAGADPTNLVGVAAHPGRNVAAGSRSFYMPPLEGVQFIGSLDTSASEGTGTVATADRGAEYGITKTALTTLGQTGRWYVDQNKTGASARVRVVELIDPVGTVQGRCAFKFLTAAKALA